MARHTRAVCKSVSQTNSVASVLLGSGKDKGAVSPVVSKAIMQLTASVNGLGGPLASMPAARAIKACQTCFHAFKSVFSLHETQIQVLRGLS
jgi:hypothetical protein